MTNKHQTSSFDFSAMVPEWPMPSFSNWVFAEPEDRMEARALTNFQKVSETFWSHAEKALDDHMAFVSRRLHEDFECAKALSKCSAPEETVNTLQAFYSKMSAEYQTHFEKQAALMRDSITANASVVDELSETAIETVNDFGKAAEKSLEDTKKPQTRARRKSAATTKPL